MAKTFSRPKDSDDVSAEQRFGLVSALASTLLATPGLDSALALIRGWQPNPALRSVAYATIALSLLLLLLLVWPRTRTALADLRLFVPLATLCLALGLLELAATQFAVLGALPFEHTRGPNLTRVFEPDPASFPGIHGPSRYTTNELGFREFEAGRETKSRGVLAIGGSTTEGTYLDDSENWPALLEARWNAANRSTSIAVAAAGISGYTTMEHLDYLDRSNEPWRFDTIVLTIGLNDMLKAASSSLETGPPPAWRRSRLIRLLLAINRVRLSQHQLWLEEDQTGAHMPVRRQVRSMARLSFEEPNLQRQLVEYRRRVALILELCERRRVRCVLVSQPTLWAAAAPPVASSRFWMGRAADGSYFAPEVLRKLLDRYDAVTREQASQAGVPYVSMDQLNGNLDDFVDDCHFSEQGARAVADELVRALENKLTSPRTGPG